MTHGISRRVPATQSTTRHVSEDCRCLDWRAQNSEKVSTLSFSFSALQEFIKTLFCNLVRGQTHYLHLKICQLPIGIGEGFEDKYPNFRDRGTSSRHILQELAIVNHRLHVCPHLDTELLRSQTSKLETLQRVKWFAFGD